MGKAFGMTEYLILPFSGMHAGGNPKRTFNTRHSSAQGIIENTLGIHSSRFRESEGPIQVKSEEVKVIVLATVYLHNFPRKRHSAKKNICLQRVQTEKYMVALCMELGDHI